MPGRTLRRWLTLAPLLLLLSVPGCKDDPPAREAAAVDAAVAKRAAWPLQQRFRFTCSTHKSVGCGGLLPTRAGGRTRAAVLQNGEDAFRARIASLRRARRSIRIQALIFRGDEAGLHIAELLKRKKKQGIEVRVIVDALSNLDWQTQWMYFDLKKHGIEVEGYEALYLQWVAADLKPTDPLRPNKRFHDKIWVVDGEDPEGGLAIVGGLNIANEYFRVAPAPANRWLDQDVALRGPIVEDVTRTFDRNFAFFKQVKGRLPAIFNPDNTWKLARGIARKIERIKIPFWRRPPIVRSIKATLKRQASLDWVPVQARFFQSRPRFEETYIEQTYLAMIARATKRVLIANAYFVPSKELGAALKRAGRRGVRVVFLTNSPATNDIGSIAAVSRYLYHGLLRSRGIEIHEWQGEPFDEGTLHAKYALFDDEDAIIGSFNLDPRSARLNSETAVVLRRRGLVRRLAKTYLETLLPKARRISLAEARTFRRPRDLTKRFKLLFALPVREWL